MAEFVADPKQQQAIEHVHGPMLVVAGAGTGKTTVLVQRIVRLIEYGCARPDEILAVTYTKNAAAELKSRVRKILVERLGPLYGPAADSLQASTFHAYCYGLLTRAGQEFTPLDKQDLYVLLRRRLRDLGLKYYIKAARPGQFLDALLSFFDRCSDELVTPERYRAYVEELRAGNYPLPRVLKSKDAEKLKREEVIARCEEIADVFCKVTQLLGEKNLGTYGHQISRAVALLESDSHLLAEEQQRARFILIDEFQDSNAAQIRLASLLAGAEKNVFAVGDPDQAIYRFRGATTGAFDQFRQVFGDVKCVVLDRNRRSLSPILRCAHRVISDNPPIMQDGQLTRTPLVSAREEVAAQKGKRIKTAPVETIITPSQLNRDVEAVEIVEDIERTHRSCPKCTWKHFAVLYRQHSHREQLIRELSRRQIPFHVRGINVLETPEVRDLLAALHAIANFSDNVAVLRLAALPQFQIRAAELKQALWAAEEHATMMSILGKVKGGPSLVETLARSRVLLEQSGGSAIAAVELALRQFKLAATPATRAFADFVAEWSEKPITDSGKLDEFIEYLGYMSESNGSVTLPDPEADEEDDRVTLMTAHGAKGMEFEHVFVMRAFSGCFPGNYREELFEFPQALRGPLTVTESDPKLLHEQEERRLFYVAMTRARDSLAIYAKEGRGRNDPTPPGFLRSLLRDKDLEQVLARRTAEFRPSIAAEAEIQAFSPVGEWMLGAPTRITDRLTLSATRIETYKDCPLRFKIEAEWKIPGEPVAAMQFGNAVHTVLKGYYDAIKAGCPLSRQTFLDSFEEAMSASRFEDEHQKQLYLEQGRRQLAEFHDLRNAEPAPNVIATEKYFEIEMEGIKVIGRIDRADQLPDGSISIVDYKTGSAKSDEDAEKSLQLSIYALAAKATWKALPGSISFYNLETNAAVATIRTEDDVDNTRATIKDVAESIKAGKFAPNEGFHCAWCGYRELCPAKEEPLYSIVEVLPAKASN